MKKEPFLPTCHYLVKNSGNNFETLFLEERNYSYFLALFHKHVGQIATLKAFRFFSNKFELLIQIKDISQIPAKYQESLHQPFSNFFNAYAQSINKAYGRSGSLFREHFKRERIDDIYIQNLKHTMEESPITIHNLPRHQVARRLETGVPTPIRRKKPRQPKFLGYISKIAAMLVLSLTLHSFKAHPRKWTNSDFNDTIPNLLNRHLPLLEKSKDKDSVFYPFEPFYDDSTGNFIAIGHLVEAGKTHAISTSKRDSLLTFYEYRKPGWKIVGALKLPEFMYLQSEDLNQDGRKEVILRTPPNMNGNCGYTFFALSEKTGQFENAGFIFGRYTVAEKQKIQYFYEGSWYGDYIQTLYKWKNDRLVPIRSVTLSLKNTDGRHGAQWIVYEENTSDDRDRMIQKLKKTFRERKHQYIVDHIFDDNFQLK